MAKQQNDAAISAVTLPKNFPFLDISGTRHSGPVCAVLPGIPVLAVLQHSGYVLSAISVITDSIVDDVFADSAKRNSAMMGVHYLSELACGLVDAATAAMQAAVS
ncbi:MAG: hypothetical protein QM661_14740 [Solimonas sp.]